LHLLSHIAPLRIRCKFDAIKARGPFGLKRIAVEFGTREREAERFLPGALTSG